MDSAAAGPAAARRTSRRHGRPARCGTGSPARPAWPGGPTASASSNDSPRACGQRGESRRTVATSARCTGRLNARRGEARRRSARGRRHVARRADGRRRRCARGSQPAAPWTARTVRRSRCAATRASFAGTRLGLLLLERLAHPGDLLRRGVRRRREDRRGGAGPRRRMRAAVATAAALRRCAGSTRRPSARRRSRGRARRRTCPPRSCLCVKNEALASGSSVLGLRPACRRSRAPARSARAARAACRRSRGGTRTRRRRESGSIVCTAFGRLSPVTSYVAGGSLGSAAPSASAAADAPASASSPAGRRARRA